MINNKQVSTEYSLASVASYIRGHYPNIRGTSLRTIKSRMANGVFVKGIIRVESARNTDDIIRRVIPKQIRSLRPVGRDIIRRNVFGEMRDGVSRNRYGKSKNIDLPFAYDITKLITEKLRTRGADFLKTHHINIVMRSKLQNGVRDTFSTGYYKFNALIQRLTNVLTQYSQLYAEPLNVQEITILYKNVPRMGDVIVYRSRKNQYANEIVDDIEKRMIIENKNELLYEIKDCNIVSPNTHKNCILYACFMAKHKKMKVDDMVKKFVKKFLKGDDHSYTVNYLCPLLKHYLKVNIEVVCVGDKYEKLIYKVDDNKETIRILIKAGHSYALFKRNDDKEEEEIQELITLSKSTTKKNNFAVYDMETITTDEKVKVYAIGFKYKRYKNVYMKNKDDDIVTGFLNYLFFDINENLVIYAHNGGKFDNVLLLEKILLSNKFIIINYLESAGRLLELSVMKKKKGSKTIFTFRDSYNLIPTTLEKACDNFGTEIKKGKIDHNKINIDNCYKPETKKYTHEYLKSDCLGLYEVLNKMNKVFKSQYDLDITSVMTNASVARKLFLSKYYDILNTPLHKLTKYADRSIREYYFGGRNECMEKLGYMKGKFYYLDYTSLYPYVMAKYKYMHGEMELIKLPEDTTKFNNRWFGFARVLFRHKNKDNIPLHAVMKDHKLVFPHVDEWRESVISTEEIRYSLKNKLGYEYKFIEVFNWKKKSKYFTEVVNDLFTMKKEARENNNAALETVAKTTINSLYGFWGINHNNRDQKIIVKETATVTKTKDESRECRHDGYLIDQRLQGHEQIGEYDVYHIKDKIEVNCSNVAIASMIASNARVELYRLLKLIKDKGGKTYYMDTDSVVTDYNIYKDKDFKKFIGPGKGCNLGELKNETGQEKGYYEELLTLGNKMYGLKNDKLKKESKRIVMKMKGINKEITYDERIIDHEKKTITYKGVNRFDGKCQLDIDDFRYIVDDYVLVCDYVTFNKINVLDGSGMVMIKNEKNIKSFYDKGNVDDDGNITPLII